MNCHGSTCTCYDLSFDKLIYQSKFTLNTLSQRRADARTLGYSFTPEAELKLETLRSYLHVLDDEYENIILGGKPCLDCNKLQSLAEKTRLLSLSCDVSDRKDQQVDSSAEAAWIAKNPYCVSREKWERLAYKVCGDLKLSLNSVETVCDITFELIRKLIPCDIMVSIAVYKQQCDLDLHISRTEEECEIDFEILSSETTCDLDLKTYKTLIENNMSYDVVRNVYENGCTLELNDSAEVMLVTPMRKYNVKELRFKDIPDITKLKKLDVDISDSKYLQDPVKFINKLTQDYAP